MNASLHHAAGRARRRHIAVAAALALGSLAAQAQPAVETMKPVVRISCDLPAVPGKSKGGVMHASGFVWPDELHVVTALHAVAGCTTLSVFSEATKVTQKATVERVLLEGDIAWLKLAGKLGVGPARAASEAPNVSGRFDIVGYPWGVDAAKSDPVTFSTGISGPVLTLDAAYGAVPELREMFDSKDQPYPTRNASIVRVGSSLQPGHSGAPIFDSKGQVAAIADGGLFKGFAGMNWSMPAHVYLPRLANSSDAKPAAPSVWALRFSAVTVVAAAPVALPPEEQAAARPSAHVEVTSKRIDLSPGEFRRIRHVPLAMLAERLKEANKGQPDGNVEFLRGKVGSPAAFEGLGFDIYEDPWTGATIGVPAQATVSWDRNLRAFAATSPDGGARMIFGLIRASTHRQARDVGHKALVGLFNRLPVAWKPSPETLRYTNVTPASDGFAGWSNGASFFNGKLNGRGQEMSLLLSASALGNHFLGFGVYAPKDIVNDLSTPDLVTYLMMQMAGNNLSEFARQ